MYKIGEYVVYKRDVCQVKDIKKDHLQNKDYYILAPVDDETLTIELPTENRLDLIRPIISKEKVEEIIKLIPDISEIEVENDKMLEYEYKNLLNKGDHEDLIKIIKTTYARNEKRFLNKKKIGEKDDMYFHKAEKLLYNEFSVVLGKSYEEIEKYVADKVEANKK